MNEAKRKTYKKYVYVLYTYTNKTDRVIHGVYSSLKKTDKIGEELKQNSMFAALPTPTKIYYSLGNNSGNCPITIRDGHKWLEKQQINEKQN